MRGVELSIARAADLEDGSGAILGEQLAVSEIKGEFAVNQIGCGRDVGGDGGALQTNDVHDVSFTVES